MRLDRILLFTELRRRGLTQTDLARKAGLSRVTVNGVLCGRSCNEKSATAIAQALGVDLAKITLDGISA